MVGSHNRNRICRIGNCNERTVMKSVYMVSCWYLDPDERQQDLYFCEIYSTKEGAIVAFKQQALEAKQEAFEVYPASDIDITEDECSLCIEAGITEYQIEITKKQLH